MGCKCTKLDAVDNYEAELSSAYHSLCTAMPQLRLTSVNLPNLKKTALMSNYITKYNYLNNAVASFQLITSINLYLSKLKTMQLFIQNPILTVSKLNEVVNTKDAVDSSSLVHELASWCLMQKSFYEELRSKKADVRRKRRWTKKCIKFFKVAVNVAFVSVLALSVVLAVLTVTPHFAAVVAASGCTAIKTVEQWFDWVWASRAEVLEEEKEAVAVMMKGVSGVHEMESVGAMVERLEGQVERVVSDAKFGVEAEGEAAMAMVVEEMRKRVVEVGELIEGVEKKVAMCDEETRKLLVQFFQVITDDL